MERVDFDWLENLAAAEKKAAHHRPPTRNFAFWGGAPKNALSYQRGPTSSAAGPHSSPNGRALLEKPEPDKLLSL
jgi:hypothetical protein